MKQTQVTIEGALSTALFIVILLASFYLPLIGIVGLFFLPVPIIYYTSKHGLKPGLVSFLVSIVLAFIFTNIIAAAVAFCFLLTGCVMGALLYRRKSSFAILVGGSLANILIFVVIYGILTMVLHANPVSVMIDKLIHNFDVMKSMSPLLKDTAQQEIDLIKDQTKLVMTLIPAFMVVVGAVYAFIIELISTPILKRLRVPYPKWPPFREWELPRSLIWYYLVSIVVLMFTGGQDNSALYTVCINVYEVLELAMILQGVSFIFFFSHSKGKGLTIPIIITIVGLLVPFLTSVIRILGIIDLGFGLRKRMKKP